MCFYTNISKYTTRIPTKLKKVLKKRFTNWAQSAPVQHEKETASEILRTTLQSISWTWMCVWTFTSTERRLCEDRLGKLYDSHSESRQRVGSRLSQHDQHSPSVICYSIHHRLVSCLKFLSDIYISC